METITFTSEQTAGLRYPIGCPVWYNLDKALIKRGVVKSAFLREKEIFYVVTYHDDDTIITDEVKETSLGFGGRCPVTISPEDGSEEGDPLEGEVVMCANDENNHVVYTVMIFIDGDNSRVRFESNIDAARVTYREVEDVQEDDMDNNIDHAVNVNTVSVTTEKTDDEEGAGNGVKVTPTQLTPTQRVVPSSITTGGTTEKIDDKERAGDGVKFTPTQLTPTQRVVPSSITTGGFSQRGIKREFDDISPSHLSANLPRFEITVPHWLWHDRHSQRSLFHFLIRGGNVNRINRESNCRVHIAMDDNLFVPLKIHVEPCSPSTALRDLNMARLMIQDLLLAYVGNDGCRGRLICELARSCWGAHRPTQSTSNAVKGINPFLDIQVECYMSIVELSYVYDEHTREKSFHGGHMLYRDFLREIASFGCELILVDLNGKRFSTNMCPPYVLVYGRTYQGVDEAVRMVKRKIVEHQRSCRCQGWDQLH